VERCLRDFLEKQGCKLSIPIKNGETGVDLLAHKGEAQYFIEVIGFKESPPARSKDFYEVFFRAVSRIKNGAKNIVIALPERFGHGLNHKATHYGEAWKRIGIAFPELEIRIVHCEQPYAYERTSWNEWLI